MQIFRKATVGFVLTAARQSKCFNSVSIGRILFSTQTTLYRPNHDIKPEQRLTVTNKNLYRGYCNDKPQKQQPVSSLPVLEKHGELVYEGGIASMVKAVKLFSLSTSILGLSLQPYILYNANELGKFTVLFGGICSFFILGTPFLLHWITKKYVTQLYFDRDSGEFTALTVTFFLRTIETKFKAADVTVPDVPGLFTTIVAKNRPLFMDMNFFHDIEVYKHMMGYDKPIDWSFPDDIKKYYEKNEKK